MAEQVPDTRLRVAVAEDRMQAWVVVQGVGAPGFQPPTEADVVAALERSKIAVTDEVRVRVKTLCAEVAAAPPVQPGQTSKSQKHLVAEGRAPTNAKDGVFEWHPELQALREPDQGTDQIDYFAVNAIITVDKGTPIGRVIPPVDGVDGADVFGAPVRPRRSKGVAIKLGAGVEPATPGSNEIVAERAGRVRDVKGKVQIEEMLSISGDVDFSSGSVDVCVDVAVKGTVRSNFTVKTTKSLVVERVIEAADVEVGGDVSVRGGVFGQELHGRVRAGGSLTVQLLNEVRVDAKGDLLFNKEILNSRVKVGGKLAGQRGTIIGGEVYARNGIEVRTVGSDAGVATKIAVGISLQTLRRVRMLERKVKEQQKSADQIREAIKPLTANMKRLLAAQRERATELLCKADEIELQVDDMQKQIQQLIAEDAPKGGAATILVGEALHAGTQLTIDTREVRLNKQLHGPVKLELRKVKNVTEVVAVNQRTGSVTVLPSTEADLDAPPTDDAESPAMEDAQHESAANHKHA